VAKDNRKAAEKGITIIEITPDVEAADNNAQDNKNDAGISINFDGISCGKLIAAGNVNDQEANDSDENSQQEFDNDSNASEFVSATKTDDEETNKVNDENEVNKPDTLQSAHISTESEKIPTLVRIANDMQFLQSSWANLADRALEDECNNELLRQEATSINQEETNEEPFQEVRYRKKKGMKPDANTKTYSTRAKVGHPNLGQ